MTAKTKVNVSQLLTATSARFSLLPKPLSGKFVDELFKQQIQEAGASRVGAAERRIKVAAAKDEFIYSFLCFKTLRPVPFLKTTSLREIRYGFLLLIERDGHLAVFHRGATGVEQALEGVTSPIPRHKLTHAWGDLARYLRLSTRRMSIGRQELRGAAYDADNLEDALPPSVASRSIPQLIRLHAGDDGTVAITPSTGRVQMAGEKGGLTQLIEFIDCLLGQLSAGHFSAFLDAFPAPIALDELPKNVQPAGLLFDVAKLLDYSADPETECTFKHATLESEKLPELLAPVFDVAPDPKEANRWNASNGMGSVARLKRLTGSYGLTPDIAKDWSLEHTNGTKIPLDRWVRENDAFSLSFSEPDYFYTLGSLYRRSGFAKEAQLVFRLLTSQSELDSATSEKGPTKNYTATTANFSDDSIFRVLEKSLTGDCTHLCCSDLGDEWADYIGVGDHKVAFYHCKDGTPTTGASDFQIVVGQALKNLARIKFRKDEISQKLAALQKKSTWADTQISRLVKSPNGWSDLINAATSATGDPQCVWRVVLVVTALSLKSFTDEMKKKTPTPHFIQLVWLLSAFASGCKERDAQPVIYCRP